MGGEQKDFGDARLFYDILTAYERVDSSVSCHVCSFNILGPGKSLLFSIPRDNIVNFYGIRIQFSYAWEDYGDPGEPSHFTYFYSTELPDDVKPKKPTTKIDS